MVRTEPRRRDGARCGPAWRVAAGCLLLALAATTPDGVRAASDVRPPTAELHRDDAGRTGSGSIVHEDHSTPIVNVQVWYHVGSKDERAGRSGFAHLFEHLMFKGSKNVEPEQHTSLVSGIGGQSNAYTTEDVTVFWETVPSQYLPMALWLEADRMATLRIDRETFDREREVVKEERRMRVENQPYGRLSEIVNGHAFTRASLQAPDDRHDGGSRGGVAGGRPRFLPDLLRADERDGGHRGRYRTRAGGRAGDVVLRPDPAARSRGAARHSRGAPAARRRGGSSSRKAGRCLSWSWPTMSRSTGTRTRTRCTWRRRSCRTARARASTGNSCTRPGSRCRPRASATSPSTPTSSMRSPSCSPATRRARRSRRW